MNLWWGFGQIHSQNLKPKFDQLIVVENVLEMASKARANDPISINFFFRPCPNHLDIIPYLVFDIRRQCSEVFVVLIFFWISVADFRFGQTLSLTNIYTSFGEFFSIHLVRFFAVRGPLTASETQLTSSLYRHRRSTLAMNFSRPIVLVEGILGQALGDPWEGWFR